MRRARWRTATTSLSVSIGRVTMGQVIANSSGTHRQLATRETCHRGGPFADQDRCIVAPAAKIAVQDGRNQSRMDRVQVRDSGQASNSW